MTIKKQQNPTPVSEDYDLSYGGFCIYAECYLLDLERKFQYFKILLQRRRHMLTFNQEFIRMVNQLKEGIDSVEKLFYEGY